MRPKILTVDDAKAVRLLAEQGLSAFDCEVGEATNGFNALFAMEKSLPDLILLDTNMPVMGGLDLLRMMKANPALQSLPIIMLTSRTDHDIMAEITAHGVNGVLLKPFTVAELLEKIYGVITLKPAKSGQA